MADRADHDPDRALLARHGARLLDLARASVLHGAEFGRPLPVDPANEPPALRALRATQVVLRARRGVEGTDPARRAGSVRAWRPLIADVSANAFAAAFADRRHAPLRPEERFDLAIAVMLLGEPQALGAGDAGAHLRAGEDGVLVEWDGGSLALFPEAWPHAPTPAEFLAEALRRALSQGLAPGAEPRLYRFSVAAVADPS